MFGLGMQEILIILLVAIVLFGARRLPEIGSGLGKAIRNFKKGVTAIDDDIEPKNDDAKKTSENTLKE